MYLIDIIPLARIPHTLPQVLSYFHGAPLTAGALVQIPLGRRQEEGVVIGSRDITDHKMEIKNADFELRNLGKIISPEPILTKQQIKLALFLGEYYFCSPGTFAKMALPQSYSSSKAEGRVEKLKEKVLDYAPQNAGLRSNNKIKQTLILVPTVARAYALAKSYPNSIIWHSELTQKQKNETRWKIKSGQAKTIIGTRSAVFLPFNNLREITIVDADSPNHRSWDMFPHYDSRLAAKKLTELFNAHLSFPRRRPANAGRTWIPGPSFAYGYGRARQARDDKIQIIDMRDELKNGNFSIFSVPLYDAVKQALADKRQAILFINRRGAANFILCRDCGYIANCPKCDTPLAYHLINNKPSLLCHHCGSKDTPPGRCPKCHSPRIKTVGSGSQKVETETHNFFPDAKISRLDSDSAPKPKDQQKIITDFVEGKADILIATPMIFSWLDELAVTRPAVVGLLSADALLHIPDFRSGERTWQMITELWSVVASTVPQLRDGAKQSRDIAAAHGIATLPTVARDDKKLFFIQTYNPDNSVLKYVKNNDHAGFAKEDMATREALNYPPFSQIVKLTFRHRDAKRAGQEAKILAAKLTNVVASPAFAGRSNPEYSKNNAPRPANAGLPPLKLRGGDVSAIALATAEGELSQIDISPALPAFLPRERGKYVWNIILKFLSPTIPSFEKGELGRIFISPEFLQKRNSLLQYVPSNWEINVDPENLL